jgi:hypothetical protein
MASEVLNMTRGMGAGLDLALTGLLFAVNSRVSGIPARAGHAFMVTVLDLAALAATTGFLSGTRSAAAQNPTMGLRSERQLPRSLAL